MIRTLIAKYGFEEAVARDAWRLAIWEVDGFVPTEAQNNWIYADVRFKGVAGGVRSGKSQSPPRAADWFTYVPEGVPPEEADCLIWLIGPDYNQCRSEFTYLTRPYLRSGLLVKEKVSMPKDGSWRAVLENGCIIETVSGDDLKKVAGHAPDFMLIAEAGQHDPGIVDKLQERAVEKRALAILSGTFENVLPWWPDKWEEWQDPVLGASGETLFQSWSMPTWTNTYVFPLGQDDPEFLNMKENMDHDEFQRSINAVPSQPKGLVFGEQWDRKLHVRPVSYDPALPLEICIDPALHTFAIGFLQWDGPRVWLVDEMYYHGKIVQDIVPLLKKHPLYESITGGTIDIAGKQQHGNRSVQSVIYRETGISLRSNKWGIDQGINAMKLRLKMQPDGLPNFIVSDHLPTMLDKKQRATGIITEMESYRWPTNKRLNTSAPKSPVDKNCDQVKAVWYWLLDRYGPEDARGKVMALENRIEYPWSVSV